MNLQQLEYFKTVAETENFTLAAGLLSVTQPALSKAIAKLEEELNVPLFEKSGRNIKLTRYGSAFLEHVNVATSEIKNGIEKISNMVNPNSGTVSISSIYSAGTHFMPYIISDFLKQNPNTKFQFSHETVPEIVKNLKTGKIDLGFYDNFQNIGVNDEIKAEPIQKDDLVLIVPKEHPLSNKSEVNLKDLKNEKFVVVCEGIKKTMCSTLENIGFKPNISLVQNEHSMLHGFVAAGLGVAVVPNSSNINENKISILKINGLAYQRTIYMGWMKNKYLSPIAETFKNFVLASVNF